METGFSYNHISEVFSGAWISTGKKTGFATLRVLLKQTIKVLTLKQLEPSFPLKDTFTHATHLKNGFPLEKVFFHL